MLNKFDVDMTKRIQAWPGFVRPLMQLASFLGQPPFTIGIGFLAVGLGWGGANYPLLYAGGMVLFTLLVGSAVKIVMRRTRPVTEYVSRMWFKSYSFPSGHSVGAVVAYGLIAYLAWQFASPLTYAIAGVAVVLMALIGISRVYLGAHYPTDVIAGWLLGAAGLMVITIVQPSL